MTALPPPYTHLMGQDVNVVSNISGLDLVYHAVVILLAVQNLSICLLHDIHLSDTRHTALRLCPYTYECERATADPPVQWVSSCRESFLRSRCHGGFPWWPVGAWRRCSKTRFHQLGNWSFGLNKHKKTQYCVFSGLYHASSIFSVPNSPHLVKHTCHETHLQHGQ